MVHERQRNWTPAEKRSVLYAEVPMGMKRTLRRLAYEWELSMSAIVQAAIEQYFAAQSVVEEEEKSG